MINRNKSIKLEIFPQTNVISQTKCILIMQSVCMEEKHTLCRGGLLQTLGLREGR